MMNPADEVFTVKEIPMKYIYVVLATVLASFLFNPAFANQSREDKQARLDGACEVARQTKLAPMRKKFVEECVATRELPSRDECVTFYADYGNRMGGRAALFYDLPECVTAFEYNNSSRSRD